MAKITIRPAWTFVSDSGEKVDPQLFELLAAIHDQGKLTLAAKIVKLSYRYAWALLGKWERFFGGPLVAKERGRGAKLTPLGEKLLWAEQRTDANLFPQLENIASELNIEIAQALKSAQPVIHIHASHGYAIEKVPALMSLHGHATVDLKYMGSVAAVTSLARGGCQLAGFHVPVGDLWSGHWREYAKWLKPRKHAIVRLVTRTQGLIVAKGNPRGIVSLADLARPGVRFVNRQRDSGTRILLDGLLARHSIDSAKIQGYESGEFTHAAVAAFVASGMADVGMGIEPAARQFKLDFIPVIKERYMLACRVEILRWGPVQELIELIRGPAYAQIIRTIAGYAPDLPGKVERVKPAMKWLSE
jgi:molybdate transport repressor ModE-like protein